MQSRMRECRLVSVARVRPSRFGDSYGGTFRSTAPAAMLRASAFCQGPLLDPSSLCSVCGGLARSPSSRTRPGSTVSLSICLLMPAHRRHLVDAEWTQSPFPGVSKAVSVQEGLARVMWDTVVACLKSPTNPGSL